jgi:hypothetical protein
MRSSFNIASPLFPLEINPRAILRTKTVLHWIPIFPDIPVIKGTKKRTKVSIEPAYS